MIIRDGDTNRAANVNDDGRLEVALESAGIVLSATLTDPFGVAAGLNEAAFYVSSYLAAAGDAAFYLLNSYAKDAKIELVISCAAPTIFQIAAVSGTAAGTDVTGTPGKLGGAITPTPTVKGNAAVTGLTAGTDVLTIQANANTPFVVPEFIVAQGHDFAVYVNSASRVTVNAKVRWE